MARKDSLPASPTDHAAMPDDAETFARLAAIEVRAEERQRLTDRRLDDHDDAIDELYHAIKENTQASQDLRETIAASAGTLRAIGIVGTVIGALGGSIALFKDHIFK